MGSIDFTKMRTDEVTWEGSLLWLVPFHVQSQMVWSGKAPITNLTLERFCPCVFTYVTSQFIRSSESPLTVGEVAGIRFLAWKIKYKTVSHWWELCILAIIKIYYHNHLQYNSWSPHSLSVTRQRKKLSKETNTVKHFMKRSIFTCMDSLMCLQVRALCVSFSTTWKINKTTI